MARIVVLTAALLSGIALGGFLLWRSQSSPFAGVPMSLDGEPSPTTFYRWHDDNGALHMANEPPPAGIRYETVTVDGVMTRMDPPKAAPAEEASTPNPLSVYTPGGMQKLIKDARHAAEATQRAREQMQQQIELQR